MLVGRPLLWRKDGRRVGIASAQVGPPFAFQLFLESPGIERAGVKVTIDPRGKISRQVRYRPVETDGAARAAACLAELI